MSYQDPYEYYIVLNPINDTPSLETVRDFLDIHKDVISYCLSFEVSPDEHDHFHLYLKTISNEKTWRQRILRKLECRSRWSSTQIRDRIRAIAYTIKDGNYYQKNLNINEFLMAQQITHPKPKKFEHARKDLDDAYLGGSITDDKFIDGVLDLYIDTKRNFYYQHALAHIHTITMEKKPDFKRRMKERLLEDIKNI